MTQLDRNSHEKLKLIQMREMNLKLTLFTLIWPLISGVLLSSSASNAQYSSSQGCDSTRLIRCQQDVLRDMQTVSLNSASIQQTLSGPPYSPSSSQFHHQLSGHQSQLVGSSACRLIRSNLDCLLSTTPACYEQGIQAAQNTDIMLRAKRFLEQNSCNQPDISWQSTFCFRSPEIRSCEERYGFATNFNSQNTIPIQILLSNASACLTYHAFKYCVNSHLRLNCKVHEMDMENEYLIDKASDLAWRCPVNASLLLSTTSKYQQQYDRFMTNNSPATLLSPNNYGSSYGSSYEQRPLPSYVGGTGSSNLGSIREQAWERFRDPLENTRFGISRYQTGGGGAGEVFDRLIAVNSFDQNDLTSDCPLKAAPYARECEDTLLEQHRIARDSRDGNELQRRMCCALFQFRDCISRVVLDRCADSSPAAVEILMGNRRREMTLTCRGFNRELCSGALSGFKQQLTSSALITLSLIILFSSTFVSRISLLSE